MSIAAPRRSDLSLLARQHAQAGRWREAARAYRETLEAEADNVELRWSLAEVYQRLRKPAEALACLEAAARRRLSARA